MAHTAFIHAVQQLSYSFGVLVKIEKLNMSIIEAVGHLHLARTDGYRVSRRLQATDVLIRETLACCDEAGIERAVALFCAAAHSVSMPGLHWHGCRLRRLCPGLLMFFAGHAESEDLACLLSRQSEEIAARMKGLGL